MSNLITLPATLALSRNTRSNGTSVVTYQDRKAYGKTHNLKGAALDRAHYAYRTTEWLPQARAAASAIVSAETQFISRIATNKRGGVSITTIDKAKMSAPKAAKSAAVEAAQAKVAELEAKLAALIAAQTPAA
jgi:hypothetical protein